MSADVDPYKYPGLEVLRNKAGIKTADDLSRFEDRVFSLRYQELQERPIKGKFDLQHLQRIHHHLFQDVYAWAGQLRTVELGKGGNWFAPVQTPAHTLKSWATKLFDDLAHDNHLQSLPKDAFTEGLSKLFTELNYAHLFREGNGRSMRAFLQELAKQGGYTLEFRTVQRDEWLHASRASFAGDLTSIQKVFEKSTTPTRALVFDRDGVGVSLRRHPELRGAVETLKKAAEFAEQRIAIAERPPFIEGVKDRLLLTLRAGELVPVPTAVKDIRSPSPGPQR